MDRKLEPDDRELSSGHVGAREAELASYEIALRAREHAAEARESAADSREIALADREQTVRLANELLDARAESDAIRADRERLVLEMRDVNGRLLLAVMRAEEQAEATALNEQRFRSLVTTSAVLVWSADSHGIVDVDSESWKAFTGIESGGPSDARWGWLQAVHPNDRSYARDVWARAIATSAPCAWQLRLRTRDASYVWVAARAVPILRFGVVREWIGTMTDISEHVRVDEAREQFIGILGHDLRNPLAAIALGAEMLRDVPEPHAGIVAKIARSASRMEALIRDVMDFTRGRLGDGIPVTLGTCDLARICTDVVGELKQAHPSHDIRCALVGDLHGDCDGARIEQVVSNLVGNAITHGEDPIEITFRGQGDQLALTVRNQGPPIPAALIPKLFEPFSRGAPRSRDSSQGLGLGLYIVSEIVRAHGGTISVASEHGEGTTFTVQWPRSAQLLARPARGSP